VLRVSAAGSQCGLACNAQSYPCLVGPPECWWFAHVTLGVSWVQSLLEATNKPGLQPARKWAQATAVCGSRSSAAYADMCRTLLCAGDGLRHDAASGHVA
jgi:hypothetical protein